MIFLSFIISAALLPLSRFGVSAAPAIGHYNASDCRFALQYTQNDILEDPTDFTWDFLYWEGNFHQNNVSYNSINGMSLDGTLIDPTTGLATEKHTFGAASKESLQIMVYAHAIAGSPQAAQFLSPYNPSTAPEIAAKILEIKLKTYLKFNETYPGFGGFLPWYTADTAEISPTWDWVNRVPALDNGELLWAVYSVIQALEGCSNKSYQQLASGWQKWLDYTKATLPKIFYHKNNGTICAVTSIKDQTLPIDDPNQSFACETSSALDDPYEGELVTWWLYFFGGLSNQENDRLWEVKRSKLESVEYIQDGIGPITVQKGYWFSSHEQWKVLEMPYYDVDIIRRVFKNAERVRTCNSVVTKNPGMFASVNNSTDSNGQILGYISNAGIPAISNQTVQELDVITPYSVFPILLFSKEVGLAWLKNIVDGKKMQNPYGTTESARIDGTAISSFVSWDSKITNVVALLGGVQDLVREKMKTDKIYDEFIRVAKKEYELVFKDLKGEDIDLCLPQTTIPDKGLIDYTKCS